MIAFKKNFNKIMTKEDIRRQILAQRDAISASHREKAAEKITHYFFEPPTLYQPDHHHIIAAYMPIQGEINPLPLLRRLAQKQIQHALPAIAEGELIFRRWQAGGSLVRGTYDICEPPPSQPEVRPDLILLPCLAFDKKGVRLGYGGGHYDRTLPHHHATRIALAFAAQAVDQLPHEPHDITMDAILTEKGWLLL